MKYIYYLLFIYHSNYLINVNNGDPFDYIKSSIPIIKNNTEFYNIINQNNTIIVIISYQNNFFGNSEFDFYEMATIYEDLKKQLIHNNKIKFYRVHMNSGIHSCILEEKSPALQIYYNKEKIISSNGKQTKKMLLKLIIDFLNKINN